MKRYTADLHLQHANILKYDNRPFKTIEEHDQAIIDIINQYVYKGDELYILWDISWKAPQSIELLKQIKCKQIYFLKWNHDFSKWIPLYEELWRTNLWLMHIDKHAKVVLCHYPMDEWFHSRHRDPGNYIHIHWHSHWNSREVKNRLDVWFTFDKIDRPISLEQILNHYKPTNEKKNLSKDVKRWLMNEIFLQWQRQTLYSTFFRKPIIHIRKSFLQIMMKGF